MPNNYLAGQSLFRCGAVGYGLDLNDCWKTEAAL